jgi:hypothetical protein
MQMHYTCHNLEGSIMKLTLNPIGQAHDIQKVNNKVNDILAKWEKDNPKPKTSWWNLFSWWKSRRSSILKVTLFLFECVDNFIRYIENEVIDGPDKKATVIAAVTIIYDYVVKEAMPAWAKPFAGKIKGFFIGILISGVIDFVVKKYNEGWEWSSEKAFAHIPNTKVAAPRISGKGLTRTLVERSKDLLSAQSNVQAVSSPPQAASSPPQAVSSPPQAVSALDKPPNCCPRDTNDGMRKKVHKQIKKLKERRAERDAQ